MGEALKAAPVTDLRTSLARFLRRQGPEPTSHGTDQGGCQFSRPGAALAHSTPRPWAAGGAGRPAAPLGCPRRPSALEKPGADADADAAPDDTLGRVAASGM